jgi:mono/diheme cytochrome c family protein
MGGFLFLALLFTAISGCKHDPDPIIDPIVHEDKLCNPDTVYFQNDILPLLLSNCATSGCHDQESHNEGVVLVDYASVMNTAEITPGNPDNSKLYKMIARTNDDRMPPPPAQGLTTAQIQNVYDWIMQGAENNRCDAACDTNDVTFSQQIWPLIQTNCTGCHSGANAGGNILLTDYQSVVAAASGGKLYSAVARLQGFSPMPKNAARLADCQIATIKIWIDGDTPNN